MLHLLLDCMCNCTIYLLRINDRCIPNLVSEYIPADGRKVVRPRKRWTNAHEKERSLE
jgi:hypothetical protein